jgi:N-acyl-D-aspartate/D-glutamate deacylase
MDALRKITFLLARRMEKSLPQMARKGRLQEGADADITVFDPNVIRERATYVNPGLTSEGIHYVLVNGILVIDKAKPVPKLAPGRWLRHPV